MDWFIVKMCCVFSGNYEYSMGTNCFFTETKRPPGIEDACFQELPTKMYDFFAKTNKVLKMKRIFVEEKETPMNDELADGEIEDLEHLRISKTYDEALNQFLKPGEKPPRDFQSYESSEEQPIDEPSEGSEMTKFSTPTKSEAVTQEEFDMLTNTDHDQSPYI